MDQNLLARITSNPAVMGGRPCIRGLRVTVGTVLGLLASGYSHEQVLAAYPYLEADDILATLATLDERGARVRILPLRPRAGG